MLMYETTRTIGACSLFAGVLTLLSHIAGQLSVGSASTESLVGGGAAILLGGLLFLLGDIGKRLVRLEEHVSGKHKSDDEAEDLADPQL